MLVYACVLGKFKEKAETLTSVARRKSEPKAQDKGEGNQQDFNDPSPFVWFCDPTEIKTTVVYISNFIFEFSSKIEKTITEMENNEKL